MQSQEVKLAKIQAKQYRDLAMLEAFKVVMDNPVVELVGWTLFTNYLEKQTANEPFWERVLSELGLGAIWASGTTVITAKALSPALPLMGQGIKDISALKLLVK